jgi:hypothetical protein
MNASLIVSIIGLCVTVGAILISAYNQYWKKADLRLAVGENVRSFKGSDNGHLVLSMPITVFNHGAQTGAVARMIGTLTRPHGSEETQIHWDRFEVAEEHLEDGKFRTRFRFGGYTDGLLVPARSAVPSRIQFRGDKAFEFVAGDYHLAINCFAESSKKPAASAKIAFTMTPSMVTAWNGTLGPSGVGSSKGSIGIPWRPI